jgi:hypothetical protein
MNNHCKEGECPRVERLDAKIDGAVKVNCVFRKIVYAGVGILLMIAGFNTWYQKDVPTQIALIEQWQNQHKNDYKELLNHIDTHILNDTTAWYDDDRE